MTKKYWNDWQKRIGETKNIYRFWFYNGVKVGLLSCTGILSEFSGDALLKADFHGDAVDLVIERRREVFDFKTRSYHYHVKNEYLTLRREEIGRVEFIKY